MADIPKIAGEAYDCFVTRKRDDDSLYVTLRDERPDWLYELVRSAHGDMLPDDWRYQTIRDVFGYIHDNEPSDLDDGHDFADSNVDTYNSDRLAWLGSGSREGYVDQAVQEGLVSPEASIMDRIGIGQYEESLEVWSLVVRALEDYAETLED